MSGIILNGSDYLERLSKSLSKYSDIFKKCLDSNETEPQMKPNEVCETVIKNSNQIRNLTEVVFLTTNKMRDKIDGEATDDQYEDQLELLIHLAWLLDQLAQLTGFNPHKNNNTDLSELSNDTATEFIHNASMEIMEQVENGRAVNLMPEEGTVSEKIQKRSAGNPLQEVANYYIKYKSWMNNNLEEKRHEGEAFDVDNDLNITQVHKRSLRKKGAHLILTDNFKQGKDKERPKANKPTHKEIKSHLYKKQSEI